MLLWDLCDRRLERIGIPMYDQVKAMLRTADGGFLDARRKAALAFAGRLAVQLQCSLCVPSCMNCPNHKSDLKPGSLILSDTEIQQAIAECSVGHVKTLFLAGCCCT